MEWVCENCGRRNLAACRLPALCGECGQPAWFADHAGRHNHHEYASWECPGCGETICYACGVVKQDESQARGTVRCPGCGYEEPYPLE